MTIILGGIAIFLIVTGALDRQELRRENARLRAENVALQKTIASYQYAAQAKRPVGKAVASPEPPKTTG